MISKYEKTNTGKLLAAVLVMAMVIAGAAVVFSDSEVSATDAPENKLSLTGNYPAFDKSPVGEEIGSIVATNTGLGNSIQATYDATNTTYKLTGTVAFQSIAYNAEGTPAWTGNNTNDSAKVFYSNHWEYASEQKYFGVVLNFDNAVNVTTESTAGDTTDKQWLIYLTDDLTARNVYDADGQKLYTIDFSGLKATVNAVTQNDIKNASGQTIVESITVTENIDVDGELEITKNTTVTAGKALNLTTGDKVKITTGAFSGTINGEGEEAGSATFTNIKAKSTGVTVSAGSITIDGDPAVPDGNGRISVTGKATISGTVDAGVTLSVEEDANADLTGLTANNGIIEIYGKAKVDNEISGKIVLDPAAEIDGTFNEKATIIPDADMDKPLYIGGELETDLPVNNATLNDNLTIPEGMTLTVSGNLFLNGKSITVNGTLVIQNKACIYDLTSGPGIILGSEGVIQNNGTIGNGNPVKIAIGDNNGASSTNSYVTMQGVSGLEFSVTKDASKNDVLMISGDVTRISSVAKNEFTAKGVVIGDFTVGKNVTMNVTDSLNVAKNSVVVINGTVTGTSASIVLDNGSSMSINGAIANGVTIKVKVGTVGDGSEVQGTETTDFTLGYVANGTVNTNVAGITVSAGRITTPSDDGKTSIITQVAYLNGTLKTIGKAVAAGTQGATATSEAMSVNGDFYVAADNTFTITKDVSFSVTGTVTVYGMIVDQTNAANIDYIGATYTITTEGENNSETEVTYYTTFDAALGVIDTVDDKTIEANVEKVSTNFTVGAGQTVEMIGSTTVVSSNATVTVEAEGSLTGITMVEGMVVVKDGGDCSIPRGGYAVRSVSADNTVTYAGLKVAISNAQPGDVIEIGTGSTTESLTIPRGVTVTVKESLTIGGDLTVAQGAKLDIKGTLEFTKTGGAKVTVNGELDASKGTVNGTYALTSPGKSSFSALPANYNGAMYQDNNGNYVITSITSAVAYAAENDLPSVTVNGTFTETSDIAIDGVNVTVNANSKVTLGNVSIKDSTITNNGALTATITGYTGDGTATAVVELTESGTDVSCTSQIDAAGATTYTTYIDGWNGTVAVASGTVVLDAEQKVSVNPDDKEANTFTVASGATLVTEVDADFSGKNVKINGTLDVQSTVSFASMTVAGTVAVNEGGVLNINAGVSVTGTITVSDVENEEGTLNINENVNVGAQPEALGAATTGSIVGEATVAGGKYVYVYSGATVAEAVFNADANGASTAKNTAFYVNGQLFVTVYAISGTVGGADVSGIIDAIESVSTAAADIKWTADGEEIEGTAAIGRYAELRTEVEYTTVKITVSAGPGLEIYIDDVVKNGETDLTVGEHSVVVYVKSGYQGTPSITFNGQTVTDGKIVITADMIGETGIVLSATGATAIDYSQSGSSDGMGLTEILLVILVILIVVMAIMVALRLMRS